MRQSETSDITGLRPQDPGGVPVSPRAEPLGLYVQNLSFLVTGAKGTEPSAWQLWKTKRNPGGGRRDGAGLGEGGGHGATPSKVPSERASVQSCLMRAASHRKHPFEDGVVTLRL